MRRQPTPQHITWFLDLYRNKQLNVNPPYQRKSVWTPKDRRFFLDTIFRNYPTPPVFVYRETNEVGFTTYHVVDGKQRMETILDFAENKIAIDKNFGDETLNGKKFKDLSTDNKKKFWDYVLVVDFLDSVDGANIEAVFDRVNRNAKNLQPQELRHARFDGWFISEAESQGDDGFWWDIKVSTQAKEKRMKNIQLISELLLIILESTIVGFSQEYLDEMYAKYDSPDETVPNFDTDRYTEKREAIKRYVAAMDEYNGCIDEYCRTANNLYTLWALIALDFEHLPGAEVLAVNYLSFMESVDDFIAQNVPEDANPEDHVHEFSYYINSKGASTDLPQRTARLAALRTILDA